MQIARSCHLDWRWGSSQASSFVGPRLPNFKSALVHWKRPWKGIWPWIWQDNTILCEDLNDWKIRIEMLPITGWTPRSWVGQTWKWLGNWWRSSGLARFENRGHLMVNSVFTWVKQACRVSHVRENEKRSWQTHYSYWMRNVQLCGWIDLPVSFDSLKGQVHLGFVTLIGTFHARRTWLYLKYSFKFWVPRWKPRDQKCCRPWQWIFWAHWSWIGAWILGARSTKRNCVNGTSFYPVCEHKDVDYKQACWRRKFLHIHQLNVQAKTNAFLGWTNRAAKVIQISFIVIAMPATRWEFLSVYGIISIILSL